MSDDNRTIKPGVMTVAPLTAVGPIVSGDLYTEYSRMLGILRDIRAEVQNLETTLTSIIDNEQMVDTAARTAEILATLKRSKDLYQYNANQITERLNSLRQLMNDNAVLYDRYGDEVVHIENAWERATRNWPEFEGDLPDANTEFSEETIAKADDILRRAKEVVDSINKIVYHSGLLTIPARLNQHLEQLRIGRALDFNNTFKDEVPSDEDRQKILEYLSVRPVAVPNGVIDVEHGLVFRAAASVSRRYRSYLYIGFAIIVGAILVYLASEIGSIFDIEEWPIDPNTSINLLVGYGFVLLGGLVHIGVDAIKQSRGSRRGVIALEDWFLWGHINESGLIFGVMSMWIGFFGLVFLMDNVQWQTAFLVGYSIDSFVDMFLQRFNVFISSNTPTIA